MRRSQEDVFRTRLLETQFGSQYILPFQSYFTIRCLFFLTSPQPYWTNTVDPNTGCYTGSRLQKIVCNLASGPCYSQYSPPAKCGVCMTPTFLIVLYLHFGVSFLFQCALESFCAPQSFFLVLGPPHAFLAFILLMHLFFSFFLTIS